MAVEYREKWGCGYSDPQLNSHEFKDGEIGVGNGGALYISVTTAFSIDPTHIVAAGYWVKAWVIYKDEK